MTICFSAFHPEKWSGEGCRFNTPDTVACSGGSCSGVWAAVPPLFYWSSLPALLGIDTRRGNLSSFPIQVEVHLAAAVTSKRQGDVPGGAQHQEKPSV